MPRSSKHKSTKHSSRDAREYSDSDKDSSLKERRSKEESGAKALKDSSFSEKRKLESKDAKDMCVTENGDYYDEHGSSKRRKERSTDAVGDRWNGGEEEGAEGSKRSKASGDSKSRRRDESVGVYVDGEEVRKSSGRSEGKHKDSSRKESKEVGADKERKFKEGRSERLVDSEEQTSSKHVFENTDHNKPSDLQSAEPDFLLDKRLRKKDGSGDGGKYAEEAVEVDDRRLSKDENVKDGRQKEKRKDEKYKDKQRDEVHKESKHRHEKQKDDRPAKEHTSSRFDEKHAREEKDVLDLRQKKRKPQEGDRRDHAGDRSREFDSNIESSNCDRELNHERNRVRDRDNMANRNRDYDHDRDYNYKRDRARDWEYDCHRDREHEHEQGHDREGSHVDDLSVRYKDTTGKRRSNGDRDECPDSKSRAVRARYADNERRTMSSVRVESNADRGRSQSRQNHIDSFRSLEVEDVKHWELMTEQRTKISREGPSSSGPPERGSKYKFMDKLIKTDDTAVDIQTERSSGLKASPFGLKERSPSTVDQRCMSKSSIRRTLEIEESGWRNSIDPRDFTSKDRVSRDIPPEKSVLDDTQADSSFYGRIDQGSTSVVQKTTPFGAGPDRPFIGSLEDDGRDDSNARFRRSVDPGFGRVPGNTWRGVPNWTSPVPNNFVPFQHGPPHFQGMLPQFPSQPMFGMRPPMEVNHAGIPFHIPDADRFPGHLRPLAWQNIIDSTGPSHLHGWDGDSSVFRDAQHMYINNSEWDRNRQFVNCQAWESSVETWKEQSGDAKKDISSPSSKHDYGLKPQVDEINQMAHDGMENLYRLQEKVAESSSFTPPAKQTSEPVSTSLEKTPYSSTLSNFGSYHFSRFYLSKLDISSKLTNPEVYDRCMALLSPKTASHENDIVDGGWVSAKGWKHSLFPSIDNSVFQRAMDLYKKQSAEVTCIKPVNRITRDNILASENEIQVKGSLDPGLGNKEDSVMVSEETTSICTSHDDKVGPVSTAGEKCQQDLILIPSMDGGGHVDSTPKSAVQQVETSSGEELGEPMRVSINYNNEAKASEQQVDSGDANGLCLPENNVIAAASTSSVSVSKVGDDLACGTDEMNAIGNCHNDPLVFEDGSSNTCASLMPESNEPESLILTRIHHSPESTH